MWFWNRRCLSFPSLCGCLCEMRESKRGFKLIKVNRVNLFSNPSNPTIRLHGINLMYPLTVAHKYTIKSHLHTHTYTYGQTQACMRTHIHTVCVMWKCGTGLDPAALWISLWLISRHVLSLMSSVATDQTSGAKLPSNAPRCGALWNFKKIGSHRDQRHFNLGRLQGKCLKDNKKNSIWSEHAWNAPCLLVSDTLWWKHNYPGMFPRMLNLWKAS